MQSHRGNGRSGGKAAWLNGRRAADEANADSVEAVLTEIGLVLAAMLGTALAIHLALAPLG